MAVMKCVTESVLSCRFFLFVKLQTFTVNGSDKVCDRICFYKTQALKKSAMKSVLVKLQAITMNGNAQVCGRFCYRLCF